MLTQAVLLSAQLLVGQGNTFPPDQVHILRAADGRPNVQLVLDSSGSMGEGVSNPTPYIPVSDCVDYWNRVSPCRADPFPPIGDGAWTQCHPDSYWDSTASRPHLTKTDQLKAVLTGCRSATDGILDKWAGRVNFALRQFGEDRTTLLTNGEFGRPLVDLEAAVRSLPAEGYTPLTPAHALASRYFHTYFNGTNTEDCRQNYIVMLTDGLGNRDYNFEPYDWECHGTEADVDYSSTPGVTNENPSAGAAYVHRRASVPTNSADSLADNICSPALPSSQSIGTYTIGFHTEDLGNLVLDDVARAGGGKFYPSSDYESLDRAFEEIITDIIDRASVNFGGGTVTNDGAFQGNSIYVAHWAPERMGKWSGNLKKYRVFPLAASGRLDPSDRTTYFVVDPSDADNLVLNTAPRDLWSGSTSLAARSGGAAEVMLRSRGGDVGDPAPTNPYGRIIKTWRPMQPFTEYVPFDGSALSLTPDETWSANMCEHMRLVNYVHGYTYDVTDCGACESVGDPGCAPVALDWPMASTIDSPTVVLKYGANCEQGPGRCFVVTSGQLGLVSFYDAYDGREVSALLPGEVLSLRPGASPIANDYLRDVHRQPAFDAPVRFYVDGGLRLFHDDRNGNGLIDQEGGTPERAYLVFGFGRGGREMALIPVGPGFDGDPDVASGNPARVLAPYDQIAGSSFSHVQDLWSSPSYSDLRDPHTGAVRQVIAFGSGHMRHLDYPYEVMGGSLPELGGPGPIEQLTVPAASYATGCEAWLAENGESPMACDPLAYLSSTLPPPPMVPRPLHPCTPCTILAGCAGGPPYCYDWPGVSTIAPAYAPPHNIVTPPLRWHDGAGRRAVAFQLVFSRLDLQSGDCINLKNSTGATVQSLCGPVGPVTTRWVHDETVSLQFVSDGVDDANAYGYTISDVNVRVQGPRRGICAPCDVDRDGTCEVFECAPVGTRDCTRCDLDRDHTCSPVECGTSAPMTTTPSVYVMDLADWAESTEPDGYRSALLMRFTSTCGPRREAEEDCHDQTQSPDLAHLVFPISSEIAKLEEGGILRALYFGDEGGQIWKLYFDPTLNDWRARRIANLNREGARGNSKDFRRIFTKLEVVRSSCNGTRSIGLYFGTGNLQRASEFDNLASPAISEPLGGNARFDRDLMGVVWDSPRLPTDGTNLDRMLNVTDMVRIDDPTRDGTQGYFIELLANEKVLRPPLVFNGVAFFKTYQPLTAATECVSSEGRDRVYAFNNCNAEPEFDANGSGTTDIADRQVWMDQATDIGAPLMLFTPRGVEPIVRTGDQVSGSAALPTKRFRKGLGLILFRLM